MSNIHEAGGLHAPKKIDLPPEVKASEPQSQKIVDIDKPKHNTDKQEFLNNKNTKQNQNISAGNIEQSDKVIEKKSDNEKINLIEAVKAYKDTKDAKPIKISVSGDIAVEKFFPPVPITEIKAPIMPADHLHTITNAVEKNIPKENYGIVQ